MGAGAEHVARPPEVAEFPSLHRLLDDVFRRKSGGMAREYARLLSERNRANLRVVVDAGRVASHAGIVVRDACVEGMSIRVALLGAVATDADYRGKGLATACVTSAMERAVSCGAVVMWISGGRGLYRRLGARQVGEDLEFKLGPTEMSRFARDSEVRELAEEHIPEVAELYAHEAVRYIRPLEDWQAAFRTKFAMNRASRFIGAWDSGRLGAYAIIHEPSPEGHAVIVEYAGARGVLLSSLLRIMNEMGASSLLLHLAHHDRTLGHRLAAVGIAGEPAPASGTCIVLDFEGLMERLRTRFLERAGEASGSELSFAEEGPRLGPDNSFSIACGPDVVTVKGRGPLAEFLFCLPGCSARAGPAPSEGVTCVRQWGAGGPFRASLPVPSLWYGLNYV